MKSVPKCYYNCITHRWKKALVCHFVDPIGLTNGVEVRSVWVLQEDSDLLIGWLPVSVMCSRFFSWKKTNCNYVFVYKINRQHIYAYIFNLFCNRLHLRYYTKVKPTNPGFRIRIRIVFGSESGSALKWKAGSGSGSASGSAWKWCGAETLPESTVQLFFRSRELTIQGIDNSISRWYQI